MVNTYCRMQGFTLIELMITVSIVAILAVTGIALTANWSKQTEINQTSMALQSAFQLAKAAAIRNASASEPTAIASQLCLDSTNNKLTVHRASNSAPADCQSPTIFEFALHPKIDIQHRNSKPFKCFSFNHYGLMVSTPANDCSSNVFFNISYGNIHVDQTLR